MGYFILDGRVRKWIEESDEKPKTDGYCHRIYQIIKEELDALYLEGYVAEFTKYNSSWILTLSRENEKVISFVFQFLNEKLAVYIYTLETKVFIYKNGFIRNAIEIITK